MKIALAAILFLSTLAARACDPADIVSFNVTLKAERAFISDVGWRNHFNFLRIMDVLPDVVTLEVPRFALAGGAFTDESAFLAAIDESQRFSSSNLYLRAVGHWMTGLAESLDRPELAGQFFAWVVNQVAVTYGNSSDGQKTATGLSAEHIVRSQFFNIFASLQDLQSLQAQGPAHALRRLNATHFSILSHFRANEGFDPLLKIALDIPSATMNLRLGEASVNLSVERAAGVLTHDSFLTLPLPEGTAPSLPWELPWALKFGLNGRPLAVVFGLSKSFADKLMCDALWYERLLTPLRAEVEPMPHVRRPVPVFRGRIGVDSSEAYEQAMYTLLTTTLALFRGAERDALFIAIMRAVESTPNVTFATIEQVARKHNLPIYLFATNERKRGYAPAWPNYQYPKRPASPPSRGFAVYFGSSLETVAREYEKFDVDAATNLELLRTDTGVLKKVAHE